MHSLMVRRTHFVQSSIAGVRHSKRAFQSNHHTCHPFPNRTRCYHSSSSSDGRDDIYDDRSVTTKHHNHSVLIYQSSKSHLVQSMEQLYVRYRIYAWLLCMNSVLIYNPLDAFGELTVALGVTFSGVVVYRAMFQEPRVQNPTLVQSMQLIVPGDYSKLLLKKSASHFGDMFNNVFNVGARDANDDDDETRYRYRSSDSHEHEREVVVNTSDIICDHDPIFASLCMPFESQWKQLLLQSSDMTLSHELRFAIVPTEKYSLLETTTGAMDERTSVWERIKQQQKSHGHSHRSAAYSVSLPPDHPNPELYVVRGTREQIEKLRAQLDYYRSVC